MQIKRNYPLALQWKHTSHEHARCQMDSKDKSHPKWDRKSGFRLTNRCTQTNHNFSACMLKCAGIMFDTQLILFVILFRTACHLFSNCLQRLWLNVVQSPLHISNQVVKSLFDSPIECSIALHLVNWCHSCGEFYKLSNRIVHLCRFLYYSFIFSGTFRRSCEQN